MAQDGNQPNPACTAAGQAYAQSTLENIHAAFADNNPVGPLHLSGTDAIRLRHALTRAPRDPNKPSFFDAVAEAAAKKGVARYTVGGGKNPFEISLDTATGQFAIEHRINKNTVHKYNAKIAPASVDPSCAPTTGVVTPALNTAAIPRTEGAEMLSGLDQLQAGAAALREGTDIKARTQSQVTAARGPKRNTLET